KSRPRPPACCAMRMTLAYGAMRSSALVGSKRGPRGLGWKAAHSLWMLPTPLFGAGTWLSFGYIAARHRRPSLLVAAAAYLVLAVLAFILVGSGSESDIDTPQTTIGMALGLTVWLAGFLHALWINLTVHLPRRARRPHP
ncbi:hypothetical protein, partial [Actinoallomurus sp. NPDC052274]|uniref:hypothetical protein n=1 Tax=Actinoallomurus sp. NPDC052274 TaxID=3155420 RepID=UPI0034164A21